MKIPSKNYRIPNSGPKTARLKIGDWATETDSFYSSKKDYKKKLRHLNKKMVARQSMLHAHNRYSLLLIFQGMDTAGKDGAIRHVMSGVNPQGCQVFSFKEPSTEELEHDFLWRTIKRLPRRGHIGIFNRSHYEEVLIAKAVPAVLAGQNLPEECLADKNFWRNRYRDIVSFEKYLHRNGTHILKFFLHISKEEQRQRLLARTEEPDKNWKISASDLKSREDWDKYQKVYEECLRNTSHPGGPWYAIPADDKKNARLIISNIVVDTLKSLKIQYPVPDENQMEVVRQVKEALTHEK